MLCKNDVFQAKRSQLQVNNCHLFFDKYWTNCLISGFFTPWYKPPIKITSIVNKVIVFQFTPIKSVITFFECEFFTPRLWVRTNQKLKFGSVSYTRQFNNIWNNLISCYISSIYCLYILISAIEHKQSYYLRWFTMIKYINKFCTKSNNVSGLPSSVTPIKQYVTSKSN